MDEIRENAVEPAPENMIEPAAQNGTGREGESQSPAKQADGMTEEIARLNRRVEELERLCKEKGLDENAEKTAKEEAKKAERALSEEEKTLAVREYLAALSQKSVPLLSGGGAPVAAQRQKPKTLREAGGLALQYFKNS